MRDERVHPRIRQKLEGEEMPRVKGEKKRCYSVQVDFFADKVKWKKTVKCRLASVWGEQILNIARRKMCK